jgi:hypothetical protein
MSFFSGKPKKTTIKKTRMKSVCGILNGNWEECESKVMSGGVEE